MIPRGILLDSDVLSHFIASGRQRLLKDILAGHQLIMLDQVYSEASFCPWDSSRKHLLDSMMADCGIVRMNFPSDVTTSVVEEFFRLASENKRLGRGERACMAVARFYRDAIASSNYRDVAPYCEANGIEYIGFLDILIIGINKGVINEYIAQGILDAAVLANNARFPVNDIRAYTPTKDLGDF